MLVMLKKRKYEREKGLHEGAEVKEKQGITRLRYPDSIEMYQVHHVITLCRRPDHSRSGMLTDLASRSFL